MNHINIILIIFVILFAILFYLHFQKKESFEGIAGSSFVSRVPKGTIVAYYPVGGDLSKNPVPAGWAFCDGTKGTPNLRGRFILGFNPNTNQDTSLIPNNLGGVGGTEVETLSLEQIPSHTHSVGGLAVWNTSCGDDCANIDSGSKFGAVSGNTSLTGGKDGITQPHNNLPPFYVLVYIMKL
jgi:microcystin-dependent protein